MERTTLEDGRGLASGAKTVRGLPDLLSPQQLADYLGIPIATIYRWHYTGDGPKRIRVGKHIRYRASDVEAWLDHQAVAG